MSGEFGLKKGRRDIFFASVRKWAKPAGSFLGTWHVLSRIFHVKCKLRGSIDKSAVKLRDICAGTGPCGKPNSVCQTMCQLG